MKKSREGRGGGGGGVVKCAAPACASDPRRAQTAFREKRPLTTCSSKVLLPIQPSNTIEMSRRLRTLQELEFKFELGAWGVTSMHPGHWHPLTRGGASSGLVSIGPHGACAPTYT